MQQIIKLHSANAVKMNGSFALNGEVIFPEQRSHLPT